MGDDDDGRPEPVVYRAQQLDSGVPSDRVELAGRLVDQEQARAGGDADGKGHQLLFAARKAADPLGRRASPGPTGRARQLAPARGASHGGRQAGRTRRSARPSRTGADWCPASWSTMPTSVARSSRRSPGEQSRRSRPPTTIRPAVGWISPPSSLRSVDFPVPGRPQKRDHLARRRCRGRRRAAPRPGCSRSCRGARQRCRSASRPPCFGRSSAPGSASSDGAPKARVGGAHRCEIRSLSGVEAAFTMAIETATATGEEQRRGTHHGQREPHGQRRRRASGPAAGR